MREMTSAISSDSESDSLIASPSSFIIFFKRSSKISSREPCLQALDASHRSEELPQAPKSDCYNALVTDVSASEKAALIGRSAARMAVRSRWGRAFTAVASSFLRVGHVLWLEVTGFFFAIFSIIGGAALVREVRSHAGPARLAVLAL